MSGGNQRRRMRLRVSTCLVLIACLAVGFALLRPVSEARAVRLARQHLARSQPAPDLTGDTVAITTDPPATATVVFTRARRTTYRRVTVHVAKDGSCADGGSMTFGD